MSEIVSVFDRIVHRLSFQLDVPKHEIKLESRLIDDLGADSLAVIECVLMVEEEFGLDISDEEAEGMRTVNDIHTFVCTRFRT